jgi:tetratricopeptide (TPR) repeat protein
MARDESTHNAIAGGVQFSNVVQGRDITVRLPRSIAPALAGLPRRTPAFTGRDADLEALIEGLSSVVVVSGLAGVGKTELAVQAAHTALARGAFPGGVLFADLFGYDPDRCVPAGQALAGFLRALGIPAEHIPPDAPDRSRLYLSVLSAYAERGRRILVVIDNAASHDQVSLLLPSEGAIETSRDTLGLLGARLLELDVLGSRAATEMLDRLLRAARPQDSRVVDHPEEASAIARLCGGLPLAVQIIGALLAEDPARPPSALVADLSGARLDELTYADTAVRAAFDLSHDRLEAGVARLFRLLPVNPGPDLSTEAAGVLAGLDAAEARRGLEALARAHFLERGATYGRWRMHDLVRLYADRCGPAERADALDRLLAYYLATTRAAAAHLDPEVRDPASAEFADRDRALAWLDAEFPNLAAAGHGSDAMACGLSSALWAYLQWRRRYSDSIALATIARDAARRLGDRRGEALALDALGTALRLVRRFEEGLAAHESALAIFRELGDRRNEATALNNLGLGWRHVGRLDDALRAHEEAIATLRELGDRHRYGRALNNHGLTLRKMGRRDEAITAHSEAAALYRELGDRHGAGKASNNLGLVLRQVGRLAESATAHGAAAQIFREVGDPQAEGAALSNLGMTLFDERRTGEAIAALRDAVRVFRDTSARYDEGMALHNLGLALREVGQVEEAVTVLSDAVQIFRDMGDPAQEARAAAGLDAARRL